MAIPWWVAVLGILATCFGIGWAIVKAYATHNWRTCQCVDCRKRRYHAHKAQGHHAVGTTLDGDIIWSKIPAPWDDPVIPKWELLSTAELEPRMVVVLKGIPHQIMSIRTDSMGYHIQVQALAGSNRRNPVILGVSWENGNRKYWEKR